MTAVIRHYCDRCHNEIRTVATWIITEGIGASPTLEVCAPCIESFRSWANANPPRENHATK